MNSLHMSSLQIIQSIYLNVYRHISGHELEQLNQIAVISGSVGYLEEHV